MRQDLVDIIDTAPPPEDCGKAAGSSLPGYSPPGYSVCDHLGPMPLPP